MTISTKVHDLVDRGAVIYNPETIHIGTEVHMDLISPNITIYPGCRISGDRTSIGPSCSLGKETPATVDNCQLADNVALNGGFFSGAVFLSGVNFGSGAHVRPATIMEEESSCAHSVGLKHTLLFPFVTLGSLINFCDCFMSGGTSRKDHSEVGSSYIHFNYTPHQDKATPSLIGDVPRGVMLDRPPIFLGGQGGLVGPCTVEYGSIIAAGTICRRDIQESDKLFYGNSLPKRYELPYQPGAYGDISRIVRNNLLYIGNMYALLAWYRNVRSLFPHNKFSEACNKGAEKNIEGMLIERINRMTQLAENMPKSLQIAEDRLGLDLIDEPYSTQEKLIELWPEIKDMITSGTLETDTRSMDVFLGRLQTVKTSSYMETIRSIDNDTRTTGTLWLQSIVDSVSNLWEK